MTDNELLAELDKQSNELNGRLALEWRYPAKPLRRPLDFEFKKTWNKLEKNGQGPWKKNAKHWFYAQFEFPEKKNGIPLKGETAVLHIDGWMPFTLWMDGQELFKENHAWLATGPIADPLSVPIVPGRQHRFIVCVEPTELPGNALSLSVTFNIRKCLDIALEIDAAAAQIRYAEALARTPDEKKLVAQAAARVDTEALVSERWADAIVSIGRMENLLAAFAARARTMILHVIGHTHIDMDWMWTWPDTVHCIRRDVKSVAKMMDDYPELTFTMSQVPIYATARKLDPPVFRNIQSRVKEGRWENAAGTWVEGDLNMADGESIARHMLYAADWTKKHLGCKAKVLWEPDTFGHPGNMPQLARLGEFDCYFHWRCNPGKHDPWPAWTWEGIDGTKITAFSSSYSGVLTPSNVTARAIRYLRVGSRQAFYVWGMGDHGGALSRWQIENLKRFRNKPVMPTIQFSTMERLLKAVRTEKPKLPGAKGQCYSLFEGCFTTHAALKRDNRKCEADLLAAESLSALAGLDKSTALRAAWIPVLFNQFHDIFDGAAVHNSYIDAHRRAGSSLATAARVQRASIAMLVKADRKGHCLTLLNPLGFERTEPVCAALPRHTVALKDSEGQLIPVQRLDDDFIFIADKVPAFSQRTYRILFELPKARDFPRIAVTEQDDYFEVESPQATSKLHKLSGAIGSYWDKTLRRELVAYGVPRPLTHGPSTHTELALNVFQVIDEAHNHMTAWLINDILKHENLLRGASVKLVESGPVFARFRVAHYFRSSHIEEDVIYYQDFPRVDFEARIDWREKGDEKNGVPQLKVSFAGGMAGVRARTEGPFSVDEIPANGMEMPTQKWADVSGKEFGFTLYNDSKYGTDALGSRLRITLLRNPYAPDPETDNGKHVIRFAFEPHGTKASNGDLVRKGMAFNRSMVPVLSCGARLSEAPQLVIRGNASVLCTSMRRTGHSTDMVLRLFQPEARSCTAIIELGQGITAAREVNFLENPQGNKVPLAGGKANLTFHPFEVKTLLVTCKGWQ